METSDVIFMGINSLSDIMPSREFPTALLKATASAAFGKLQNVVLLPGVFGLNQ